MKLPNIIKLFEIPDNKIRDEFREDAYYYLNKIRYFLARFLMKIISNKNLLNKIRSFIITKRSFIPKELLIMKGDTVVQVGTHKQETVERLIKSVGPSGLVIIIEADRGSYEYLKKFINKRKFNNASIINKAASDKKGQDILLVSSILSDHRLRDENILHDNDIRGEGYITEERVQIDTIDNILSDLKIKQVDYIEITVNGAELKVLNGMSNSIENIKKIYTKGYAIDKEKKETISKDIIRFLEENKFQYVIGKPSKSVASETWGERSGDIFAYKD